MVLKPTAAIATLLHLASIIFYYVTHTSRNTKSKKISYPVLISYL